MRKLCWKVALCALFLFVGQAFADGVLIVERPPWIRPPWPPPWPPPRPVPTEPAPSFLPVKYHRVTVTIENQVATTRVDQSFKNDSNFDLEATYLFPIPEDAAIREFAMYADGKRLTAEVLDKDKARKIYEDIVRKMRDPGLLEYVGRNLFKARVYPVPKHGEKRIELVYQQLLPADAGLVRYSYPLNTEKFSPLPLEDASVSVKVKSEAPIKSIYSPSHEVDRKLGAHEASCGWEAKNVKPDQDFVVYYAVSEKDIGLNVLSYRKAGEDGYFLLMLSPGELDTKAVDKDVVFVFDTSGSMRGEKIEQAREALRFCIHSLNPGDRFSIVSFATDTRKFRENLAPATKAVKDEALSFVGDLKALGGTDINSALEAGLGMFGQTERPNMLVFLTDGEPTVGVTNAREILATARKANARKARAFVFGVGDGVNTILLDQLAQEQRGVADYVTPKEKIEERVSSFYRKVSEPVLTDIVLGFGSVKAYDVLPKTLPDVFRGGQVLVTGRYSGSGATAVTLTGQAAGRQKKWTSDATFVAESRANEFVPNLWATRRIGYLMAEIRDKGENRELMDEIVRLSKEFGIITPYTSFLILEDTDRRGPGADGPRLPAAAMPGEFRGAGGRMRDSMNMTTGASAVERSKEIQARQDQAVAYRAPQQLIRQVSDKNFYQDGRQWVDGTFRKEMRIQQVKYLSDDYFELLKKEPGIGRYLAVGSNVTVVYKGQAYQVVED